MPRTGSFASGPTATNTTLTDDSRAHYLLWPLISYGEGDHESMARLLPLFYRRTSPDRSLTLLPPFLQTSTPARRFSLLFPLYWSYAGTDRRWTAVPPVAWGESGER